MQQQFMATTNPIAMTLKKRRLAVMTPSNARMQKQIEMQWQTTQTQNKSKFNDNHLTTSKKKLTTMATKQNDQQQPNVNIGKAMQMDASSCKRPIILQAPNSQNRATHAKTWQQNT